MALLCSSIITGLVYLVWCIMAVSIAFRWTWGIENQYDFTDWLVWIVVKLKLSWSSVMASATIRSYPDARYIILCRQGSHWGCDGFPLSVVVEQTERLMLGGNHVAKLSFVSRTWRLLLRACVCRRVCVLQRSLRYAAVSVTLNLILALTLTLALALTLVLTLVLTLTLALTLTLIALTLNPNNTPTPNPNPNHIPIKNALVYISFCVAQKSQKSMLWDTIYRWITFVCISTIRRDTCCIV